MVITKYGYDVVGAVVAIVVVASLLVWFFVDPKPVKYSAAGVLLALLVFTLYFFRDPERVPPEGDNLVLAPADGKVVFVQEVEENEFLGGEAVQVSIFMSPLNVHVNRFPISGTVRHFQHFPGEYLVAYDEKSSLRNERTHIGVENETTKVLFKQIAGFVARRIVAEVEIGDSAVAGERFGMIKFGSRVDVLFPRGLHVRVQRGDRTVAGETILATGVLPPSDV
ncbi:MAG: phosphatidylserine decarboxylase family protein [Bacteroidota bacterium]